jgi:ketosteroid isomerase-like protein
MAPGAGGVRQRKPRTCEEAVVASRRRKRSQPLRPPVRGWDKVAEVVEHAASLRSDGEFVGSENVAKYVTAELAYVVQIERAESKVGGMEEISPYALRATMIFRPEEGTWKVVHRHADPITTVQPAESVIQE